MLKTILPQYGNEDHSLKIPFSPMNFFKTLAMVGLVGVGMVYGEDLYSKMYYLREAYKKEDFKKRYVDQPYAYAIGSLGDTSSMFHGQYVNSESLKKVIESYPKGSIIILTGNVMPPQDQLSDMIDYCERLNIKFINHIKIRKSSPSPTPQ